MELAQAQEIYTKLLKDLKEKGYPVGSVSSVLGVNKCTSSLGRCRKYFYGAYKVELSKYLLGCSEQLIKDTLLHEIIHTFPRCFNHSYNFKHFARIISEEFNANVQVKSNSKEFAEQRPVQTYKYKITCLGCGATFYRKRLPKNIENYTHSSCGGKLKVEKLR